MTGAIGVGFLNGIIGLEDIIKARESIEEFTDIPTPENPQEGISESSTVVIT